MRTLIIAIALLLPLVLFVVIAMTAPDSPAPPNKPEVSVGDESTLPKILPPTGVKKKQHPKTRGEALEHIAEEMRRLENMSDKEWIAEQKHRAKKRKQRAKKRNKQLD